jgi:hypothetical protein
MTSRGRFDSNKCQIQTSPRRSTSSESRGFNLTQRWRVSVVLAGSVVALLHRHDRSVVHGLGVRGSQLNLRLHNPITLTHEYGAVSRWQCPCVSILKNACVSNSPTPHCHPGLPMLCGALVCFALIEITAATTKSIDSLGIWPLSNWIRWACVGIGSDSSTTSAAKTLAKAKGSTDDAPSWGECRPFAKIVVVTTACSRKVTRHDTLHMRVACSSPTSHH